MRLVVALLVLALVAPAPGMASGPSRSDEPGVHASKKKTKKKKKHKKAVKCKRGQVRVKLGKRIRCSSVNAALPRPKVADQRLLMLQSALSANWGRLRDRRGRRAPSIAKVFRRVGPSAYRTTLRALPRAMALLDRAPPSRAAAAVPRASTGALCGRKLTPQEKAFLKDDYSFSEKANGISLEVVGNLDSIAFAITGKEQNGQQKRLEMEFDLCKINESVQVPGCPTSQGVVDAKQVVSASITIVLLEGGKPAYSFTERIEGTTKLHGQVADDAKLDYIDVDDAQTVKESTPSQGILIGATSVSGKFVRHTRVGMRTTPEQYKPEETEVTMSASLGGLAGFLVGDEFRQNATKRLKQGSDKLFAATVAKAIESYRVSEANWNEANKCVEVKFAAASGSLKLRKGQSGQFTGQVTSKYSNGDPGGRWSLTGQANGTFSPASAEGGKPLFNYSVTNAGKNIFVKAAFRVTTKAGVAQADWTQETEDKPLYLGEVHLTVSFDSPAGCGEHQTSTYDAGLGDVLGSGQPFEILATDPTTGEEGGGVGGYNESESGSYHLAPCDGHPGCSADLTDDPDNYGVGGFGVGGETVNFEFDQAPLKQTADPPCGVHRITHRGSFPRSMIGAQTITVDLSYQDDVTTISGTLTLHRVN